MLCLVTTCGRSVHDVASIASFCSAIRLFPNSKTFFYQIFFTVNSCCVTQTMTEVFKLIFCILFITSAVADEHTHVVSFLYVQCTESVYFNLFWQQYLLHFV